MLPLRDELLASLIVADRRAEAERSRLVRACVACARRTLGHLTLLWTGHLLVWLGTRLETLGGGRPPLRPLSVRRPADLHPGV